MRTQTIVIAIGLVACERDPSFAPPAPAPRTAARTTAPAKPPVVKPPEVVPRPKPAPRPAIAVPHASTELPREAAPAPVDPATGLPDPPSEEPKAYAHWLQGLPKSQQKQIAAYCRKHRQDFEHTCGGIGPLHIPYPPYPRAAMPRPGDRRSLFATVEAWHGALSQPQIAYLQRECPGGEDQPSSDLCGDNTPLVVVFDDQPVRFASGGRFAFEAGVPVATDWPSAATPWIALDRDGNGAIDSGAELFGSATPLPGGGTAVNGFAALAALDANHDGRIDASDPAFAALVLWADRDGDQHSSAGELTPLASRIESISLADHSEPRCDARGNCENERAAVTWRDARGALRTGAVVDVYLPRR